jgi:hypothetical protein
METWSFANLDLGGNKLSKASSRLRAGKYICKIESAKITSTKDNQSKQLEVRFIDVDGHGDIVDYIMVHTNHSTKGHQDSVAYGRDKLKSLLTFAKHPNPDRPGDVGSLVGLKVGVLVNDAPYKDADGNERNGSEVRSFGAFFPTEDFDKMPTPASRVPAAAPAAASTGAARTALDDDIPF